MAGRRKKKRQRRIRNFIFIVVMAAAGSLSLYTHFGGNEARTHLSDLMYEARALLYEACEEAGLIKTEITLEEIPEYTGEPFVEIDGNIPQFAEEDFDKAAFEIYSPLDILGRCGTAYAKLGSELMPQEERESISDVKPTGWHSVQYEGVDQGSLYNRCHLIGFQLAGENANEKNLITGTRYMNVEGMLPFENQVASYIRKSGNHVMYRVTPIYNGADMVAAGVQIEAESVEDKGSGVRFNVYCYNVQPGIEIDYATGESRRE